MSVTLSPLEHITTRRGCLAAVATNASAFSYDPTVGRRLCSHWATHAY